MGYLIKQSQTAQPLVFLMLDSGDHLTGKTGLSPTVTISKNGGSFASPSGAVTEIGSGWYQVAGNATDTGTLGPLLLHATASGADPCDDRFDVVAFDPQSATSLGLSNLDAAVTSRLASGSYTAPDNSSIAAIKAKTDNLPSDPADASDIAAAFAAVPAAVWASGTRSLTTFGTLVADVWSYATRLLTAGTNIALAKGTGVTGFNDPTTADIADAVCDEAISGHTTAGTVGAQLASVYAAQIDFVDDDTNSQDEYSVQWFKNGVPVTSGVTSPTIQVVNRYDGTDLVASTDMTQIGSTGAYKYNEATNRIADGEGVLVVVSATIDGSARTWRKWVGRDAA